MNMRQKNICCIHYFTNIFFSLRYFDVFFFVCLPPVSIFAGNSINQSLKVLCSSFQCFFTLYLIITDKLYANTPICHNKSFAWKLFVKVFPAKSWFFTCSIQFSLVERSLYFSCNSSELSAKLEQ